MPRKAISQLRVRNFRTRFMEAFAAMDDLWCRFAKMPGDNDMQRMCGVMPNLRIVGQAFQPDAVRPDFGNLGYPVRLESPTYDDRLVLQR